MKESVILSFVILVTLQVFLSLFSVKGAFVGAPLAYCQKYVSMSVTLRELDLGSIIETTFAAVARARTREPFIYNNGVALNREFEGVLPTYNTHLIERISSVKEKDERGREEVRDRRC